MKNPDRLDLVSLRISEYEVLLPYISTPTELTEAITSRINSQLQRLSSSLGSDRCVETVVVPINLQNPDDTSSVIPAMDSTLAIFMSSDARYNFDVLNRQEFLIGVATMPKVDPDQKVVPPSQYFDCQIVPESAFVARGTAFTDGSVQHSATYGWVGQKIADLVTQN